ncbi:MAG TPA: hypothetical protein VFY92_12695 [Hyphomicrobiaceae bacterium]|nr:hypothetical protein [Hyphomicrobiaceae bacterium]
MNGARSICDHSSRPRALEATVSRAVATAQFHMMTVVAATS